MSIDQEHDALLNSSWWTTALLQRRALDVAAHDEKRAQQSADPHAVYEPDPNFVPDPDKPDDEAPKVLRPTHGSAEYTLTAFEREWLIARINDAHVQHLTQRDEGRTVLQESLEEHEARELHARALSYFGMTHDDTRAHFVKLRETTDAHRRKVAARLDAIDQQSQPVEHGAFTNLMAAYNQTIKQIDGYGPLVDRHIATVKAEIAEARRAAQKKIDDCNKLISVPHADQVAAHHERVERELRASR